MTPGPEVAGDMARRIARHPWERTPLGPREDWPPELLAALAIMLESRQPMLVWWGPDFTMFYNDAFAAIAGTKHPAGLGSPGWAMFDDVWPVIGPMLRGVLATGEATWVDDQRLMMNRRGRDEETFWTYSYSPIRTGDGTVTGVFTATTDTTDRVLGERRLRTLQALGTVSTATAPSAEQACRALVAVLADHPDDLPAVDVRLIGVDGTQHRVATHGGPTDVPDAVLRRVVELGETVEGDGFVVLPAGAAGRPVAVLALGLSPARLFDEEYRSFCTLVAGQVAAAVTAARVYEEERHRVRELAELDRAKTAFFSDVSHELRTPLTLILGPVEQLLAADAQLDPHRTRTELDLVRRNALRLRRLVDTLLDLSRLQAGRVEAAFEPVDLAAVTAELAGLFRSAVEHEGLALVVDCPPLDRPVFVDRDMWEKVLVNLLSNALKHTFDGSITVTLRTDFTGGAVLTLADTGIGIPAAELPRVFERFHRVRDARSRSVEGTGIGLALVHELVTRHGGRIDVHSTPDVGTTITVHLLPGHDHLPADLVRERSAERARAAYPAEASRLEPSAPASTTKAGPPGGRARVVLADDNADMRAYLVRLLEPEFDVLAVADGAAALATVRAEPPDLLLSDVMMPGPDGMALTAALRADPKTAHVPIVLLSARAGEEAAGEGLASGADDYLVKPFSAPDLLNRVRSTLDLARLRTREGEWRSALLDAIQDGFFVVDPDGDVVEINSAFADVLGYGPEGLPYRPPHPWWPDAETEPEQLSLVTDAMQRAFVVGGRFVLPLRHRDGRHLWGECQATLAPTRDGRGQVVVGTVRDVTASRRAQEATALLAELGRVQAQPGPGAERLGAVLRAAVPALGDFGSLSLRRLDGRFGPWAVAAPGRPALEQRLLALAPHHVPRRYREQYLAGVPFVVSGVPDEVLREVAAGEADLRSRRALTLSTVLVVPLVVAGRLLGSVSFGTAGPERRLDDVELELAAELGRRMVVLVQADRVSVREHHLQRMTSALADAGSVGDAARSVTEGMVEVLDAATAAILVERPGRAAELAHRSGAADVHRDAPGTPCGDGRDGAVWVHDEDEWADRYPAHPRHGLGALAVVPLQVGSRLVGVLSIGFATRREFDPDERDFLSAVAAQAASAFERAALADIRHEVADTLQHSLLPPDLPRLDRIALAARYLPASWGSRTGGDWYDVLSLDEHRVAVVVGDVVGQGPAAAAVMGQLRSALAAYLLDGHGPAAAMTRLDRFSHRVAGARASTALCLVLDTRDGTMCWARAGHPPPLVLGPSRTDFLGDVVGIVLGVGGAPAHEEGHARLMPGETVVLYTDGLIERRDEVVDDGLSRLAEVAGAHHGDLPADLIEICLDGCLDVAGPGDDVAVIAARLRPPPLELSLPVTPDAQRAVRVAVRDWARAAGLPASTVEDLQLAVGEAVGNSVAHSGARHLTVRLHHRSAGDRTEAVEAVVVDGGTWRAPPDGPGHRGSGLAVIRATAEDVDLDTTGPGTRVVFTVPVVASTPVPRSTAPGPYETLIGGGVQITEQDGPDGVLRLVVRGELDIATVGEVATAISARLHATPGPLVVDLRALGYLSSAGVGLLADVHRDAPGRIRVVADPHSPAARTLAIAGLGADQHPGLDLAGGGSPAW